MFVFFVLYSKDKRQSAGQPRGRNKYERSKNRVKENERKRISVEARFSAPVQTGPCITGNWFV
jgi:hypothetical protein